VLQRKSKDNADVVLCSFTDPKYTPRWLKMSDLSATAQQLALNLPSSTVVQPLASNPVVQSSSNAPAGSSAEALSDSDSQLPSARKRVPHPFLDDSRVRRLERKRKNAENANSRLERKMASNANAEEGGDDDQVDHNVNQEDDLDDVAALRLSRNLKLGSAHNATTLFDSVTASYDDTATGTMNIESFAAVCGEEQMKLSIEYYRQLTDSEQLQLICGVCGVRTHEFDRFSNNEQKAWLFRLNEKNVHSMFTWSPGDFHLRAVGGVCHIIDLFVTHLISCYSCTGLNCLMMLHI
jgi:hypothetical protein